MKKILALLSLALVLSAQNGWPLLHRFTEQKLAKAEAEEAAAEEEVEAEFYTASFVISAYYSPLPGQSRYATGSYEGDIRLNGNGTNGADGTPVYPGMIAAPSKYAFGTKMNIPGIGMTSVHDRGGAIVATDAPNSRGYAYDRLDVWMGHGDEGLRTALNWGKRTVHGVQVYGVRPDLKESVYVKPMTEAETLVQATLTKPLEFPKDIYHGSSGAEVRKMQNYLVEWGYLNEATGFYGDETAEALYQFQLDFVDSVDSPSDLGAGHFGINTRQAFDKLIHNGGTNKDAIKVQQGAQLMSKYQDLATSRSLFSGELSMGSSGDDVRRLQEELVQLGYLRISPTGYFGETTEHALFKYQQAQGIVIAKTDTGAGVLGPNTRRSLNQIIEARYQAKSLIAYHREEVTTGRHIVKLPGDLVASIKEEE